MKLNGVCVCRHKREAKLLKYAFTTSLRNVTFISCEISVSFCSMRIFIPSSLLLERSEWPQLAAAGCIGVSPLWELIDIGQSLFTQYAHRSLQQFNQVIFFPPLVKSVYKLFVDQLSGKSHSGQAQSCFAQGWVTDIPFIVGFIIVLPKSTGKKHLNVLPTSLPQSEVEC